MPDHKESEGRNRWGTARERDRRRARREIRARVTNASEISTSPSDNSDKGIVNQSLDEFQNVSLSEVLTLSGKELEIVQTTLRHVEAGKASAFSLTTLSIHFDVLNKPVSVKLLSPFKIKTLCTSRFGPQLFASIHMYVDARVTCTLFEYASWLGEYRLLGPMIAGGFDPTLRGQLKSEVPCTEVSITKRRKVLSARLLKRWFDSFPSSLSSYIVKRVVDMRLQYWKEQNDCTLCVVCGSCDDPAMLAFGSPCQDVFCENCLWQDVLDNIDDRNYGDVVLCPVCGASESNTNTITNICVEMGETPAERCRESLEKFQSLPLNSKELKKTRPKRRQRALCSSWSEAVSQSIGSSQDVRNDKFFNYAERNAFHFVRGCLVHGVDVNATNEYGQTCLFIASWRGYTKIVKLLLYFGADPLIAANGGVSAASTSETNGNDKIVQLLRQHSSDGSLNGNLAIQENPVDSTGMMQSAELEVLIDVEADHPGAGSYLVDGGFSSRCIDSITELWHSLPVDHCEARKRGQKSPCSVRSYYCDSQGLLSHLLTDVIRNAFENQSPALQQVVVFPHMRFLHYAQPGSVLPPHVDLPRTDVFGTRSTHTFILYLYDCNEGGETSLLGAESGDDRTLQLAKVSPRKGRLLLFPHSCPHEGNEVVDVPKVLVRGEVLLTR